MKNVPPGIVEKNNNLKGCVVDHSLDHLTPQRTSNEYKIFNVAPNKNTADLWQKFSFFIKVNQNHTLLSQMFLPDHDGKVDSSNPLQCILQQHTYDTCSTGRIWISPTYI